MRDVVLVHGILSNGSWYKSVGRVLWPFFDAKGIKYREYHAFGPINIFFWPWALLLGGLLGWFTVRKTLGATVQSSIGPFWFQLGYLAFLLLFSMFQSYRAGMARALPWLLVAGFCAGGTGALWSLTLVLFGALAGAVIDWFEVGKLTQADIPSRRSVWMWMAAVIATVLACAFGWLLRSVDEVWLLRGCLVGVAIYLQVFDLLWNRWRTNQPWPVYIGAIGFGVSFLVDDPIRAFVLWWTLVGLMAYLEMAESPTVSVETYLFRVYWPAAIFVVAVALLVAWKCFERYLATGFLISGALVLAGWWEPRIRVRRAVSVILAQLNGRGDGGLPPSWIAHSLGTFLSGEVFRESDFAIDRVLFVGAAISEEFDWLPHVAAPARIEQIRNESGTWDIVIRLLWFSGSWAKRRGLGGAGKVGMRPPGMIFHDVRNYRLACANCVVVGPPPPPPPPVRVHNYCLDRFRHSTYFVHEQHARNYWVPYLLGHAPDDNYDFMRKCHELLAAYLERGQNRLHYQQKLDDLMTCQSNWYLLHNGRQSFADYVVDEVGPSEIAFLQNLYPGPAGSVESMITRLAAIELCQLFAVAIDERRKEAGRNPQLVKLLNPPIGIRAASKLARREVAAMLAGGFPPSNVWLP